MASIKKDYNSMGLPMNINRSNPIPVDCTELWYSLEEAQNYAQNDPRAYVGQSVKVVENNTVAVYIIENTDGSLMKLADVDSVGGGGTVDLEGVEKKFYITVDLDGVADVTGAEFANLFGYNNRMIPVVRQLFDPQLDLTGLEWVADREYEFVGFDFEQDAGVLTDVVYKFSCVEDGTIYTCNVRDTRIDNNNPVTCIFSIMNIEEVIDEKIQGVGSAQSYAIIVTDGVTDKTNGEISQIIFQGTDLATIFVSEILEPDNIAGMTMHGTRHYEFVKLGIEEDDSGNAIGFRLYFTCVEEDVIYNCVVIVLVSNSYKDDLVSITFTTTPVGDAIKAYPMIESTNTIVAPDRYQIFGTVDSLSITLEEINDGYAHEYCFEFTTGNEFYGMNILPAPKWVNEPIIETNKTYQVSILRGIGVIAGA